MNREGHLGLALVAVGIVGTLFLLVGSLAGFVLAFVTLVGTAGLPDIDTKTPIFKHRGWTHTVWFAGVVGIGYGALILGVVWMLPHLGVVPMGALYAVCAAVLAFLGVMTHVAGDVMTTRGVRPFTPVTPRGIVPIDASRRRYRLNWFRSSNQVANILTLILGVMLTLLGFFLTIPVAL